jgi:hypothetical protein
MRQNWYYWRACPLKAGGGLTSVSTVFQGLLQSFSGWILGVKMSAYRLSLIAMGLTSVSTVSYQFSSSSSQQRTDDPDPPQNEGATPEHPFAVNDFSAGKEIHRIWFSFVKFCDFRGRKCFCFIVSIFAVNCGLPRDEVRDSTVVDLSDP